MMSAVSPYAVHQGPTIIIFYLCHRFMCTVKSWYVCVVISGILLLVDELHIGLLNGGGDEVILLSAISEMKN